VFIYSLDPCLIYDSTKLSLVRQVIFWRYDQPYKDPGSDLRYTKPVNILFISMKISQAKVFQSEEAFTTFSNPAKKLNTILFFINEEKSPKFSLSRTDLILRLESFAALRILFYLNLSSVVLLCSFYHNALYVNLRYSDLRDLFLDPAKVHKFYFYNGNGQYLIVKDLASDDINLAKGSLVWKDGKRILVSRRLKDVCESKAIT